MQEPIVRRAEPSDAAQIAALGAATFTETFGHLYPPADLAGFLAASHSPAAAAAVLADPAHAAWLAVVGGEAVGYAVTGPCDLPHPDVTPGCLELKRLYVLKPWQGGGVAVRLMAEAMAWMRAAAPPAIYLGVWSENHRARKFYARYGFARVGEYEFPVGATRDLEFIYRLERQGNSST